MFWPPSTGSFFIEWRMPFNGGGTGATTDAFECKAAKEGGSENRRLSLKTGKQKEKEPKNGNVRKKCYLASLRAGAVLA